MGISLTGSIGLWDSFDIGFRGWPEKIWFLKMGRKDNAYKSNPSAKCQMNSRDGKCHRE